jgi:hypothetical protein
LFLDERDGAADRQAIEDVAQHAALLKVHLVSVWGLDESVRFVRKQPRHTTPRLSSSGLHIAALSPCEILQSASGDIEGVSDGHLGVLKLGVRFA